jgi:EF-hand domain pair
MSSFGNKNNGSSNEDFDNDPIFKEESSFENDEECTGKSIMSMFFNDWDEDHSGTLDVDEVLAGIEMCCDALNIDYDSRRISALFNELDSDGNHELDRKEFTKFLQIYADNNDIGMVDLAFVMADHLSRRESERIPDGPESKSKSLGGFFYGLFSTTNWSIGKSNQPMQSKHLEEKERTSFNPFRTLFAKSLSQRSDLGSPAFSDNEEELEQKREASIDDIVDTMVWDE